MFRTAPTKKKPLRCLFVFFKERKVTIYKFSGSLFSLITSSFCLTWGENQTLSLYRLCVMFTFVLQLVYTGWLTATKLTAEEHGRSNGTVSRKTSPLFRNNWSGPSAKREKGKRGVRQKQTPSFSLLTHTTRRNMDFQRVVRVAVVVQLWNPARAAPYRERFWRDLYKAPPNPTVPFTHGIDGNIGKQLAIRRPGRRL